jgi:hypothetical protein
MEFVNLWVGPICRAFLSILTALACSAAQARTLIRVPQIPNTIVTTALAINDKNNIAGNYTDSQAHMHAFVGTIDGDYTTFDYRSETAGTWATGIDDKGNVTGIAKVLDGGCSAVPFERTGAGVISTVHKGKKDFGGAMWGGSKGVFTGVSCDKKGNDFNLDEKNAK